MEEDRSYDDYVYEPYPPGIMMTRFTPKDEELIVYLTLKNKAERLPSNVIQEVDLYKYHPGTLTSTSVHLVRRKIMLMM